MKTQSVPAVMPQMIDNGQFSARSASIDRELGLAAPDSLQVKRVWPTLPLLQSPPLRGNVDGALGQRERRGRALSDLHVRAFCLQIPGCATKPDRLACPPVGAYPASVSCEFSSQPPGSWVRYGRVVGCRCSFERAGRRSYGQPDPEHYAGALRGTGAWASSCQDGCTTRGMGRMAQGFPQTPGKNRRYAF